MWTGTTLAQYAREGRTLPSNLTGAEWALLEPFFPPPSHVGRPRKWPMRRIVEAILYLLRGGLAWRMLPPCFPPVSTMRRWFYNVDIRLNVSPFVGWYSGVQVPISGLNTQATCSLTTPGRTNPPLSPDGDCDARNDPSGGMPAPDGRGL